MSIIYSQTEDSKTMGFELTIGSGTVSSVVPEFKGLFAVNDASASASTYFFDADVSGQESHTPINLGLNADITELAGMNLGSVDLLASLQFGYSFLDGGAGIINAQFVPNFGYRASDWLRVGLGFGIGYLEYQIDFDVERESAFDIYMTYDETNIYFDDDGKAKATLKKSGLVTAPEFSLKIGPPDATVGLQFRYQALAHSTKITDPWQMTFKETDGDVTSDSDEATEVTIDYEGQYVSNLGETFPSLDLSGGLIALELIYRFK